MTKFHAEVPYFVHLSKTWPHGGVTKSNWWEGVRKKVGGVNPPPEGGVEKSLVTPTVTDVYTLRTPYRV